MTEYDRNLARLQGIAQERGLTLNPDQARVQKVVELMTENFEEHGDYYCPCKQEDDAPVEGKDPLCPCPEMQDEIAQEGHCACRLFFTKESAKTAENA